MADTPTHRLVCPACGTTNRVPQDRPAAAARCGACHAPLFTGRPTEVDEAGLARHLAGNDIPVMFDVWAAWCGPCLAMAPAFTAAAAALEPRVRLLKLDADTAPATMARLAVQGIPALFLFRSGEILARTAGAMDASRLIAWAHRALGDAQAA